MSGLDPIFASLIGETINEDDIQKEREALMEIERLQRELEGEGIEIDAPPLPPQQPPPAQRVYTPVIVDHNPVVGTIQTRASRRKRTADVSRPGTAQTPQQPNAPVKPTSFTPITPPQDPESIRARTVESQLQNAISSKDRSINEIRSRFESQLKVEIERMEREHSHNLELLKEWFETKKNSFEISRRQQEKLQSLSQTLNKHSQTVQSLSQQFARNQSYNEELKENELQAKEKLLEQREARLLTQAQLLENDKKRLQSRQQVLTELETQRKEILLKDKQSLHTERNRVEDFSRDLKQRHNNALQKLAVETHKLEVVKEALEREEQTALEEIQTRENLLIEKSNFLLNNRQEQMNKINNNRSLIIQEIQKVENFKRTSPHMMSELARRMEAAEELLASAKSQKQQIADLQIQMASDQALFDEEAAKVHEMSLRINKQTEDIVNEKKIIDADKEKLEQDKQKILLAIANAKEAQNSAINRKKELATNMKAYENLKSEPAYIDIPKLKIDTNNLFGRSHHTPIRRPTNRRIGTGFKADDYLDDLKKYSREREDFQSYLKNESDTLLQSKIAYETGLTKSLLSSVRKTSNY